VKAWRLAIRAFGPRAALAAWAKISPCALRPALLEEGVATLAELATESGVINMQVGCGGRVLRPCRASAGGRFALTKLAVMYSSAWRVYNS